MEPQGWLGAEGDCGMLGLLVPSPQSEAVTHELEELTLQPTQKLPPLNERKNVLQLRLQQRRTREQLVDQGIMPPLKSPAAFHEQIRSLERARTENFLKHKIRSRPERSELVRMHILQETGAEPSLQATQMRLKRARLADDLNEKISQRPGPMELVVKNILPVDSSVKEAIIEGQVDYPGFDEDSGDALSPEQPASHESQTSAPSPGEARAPETPSPSPLPSAVLPQSLPVVTQVTADFLKGLSSNEQPVSRPAAPAQPITTVAPSKPGPTLVKQSQPKQPSEKSRSKKGKEAKSKVKKLKYHQYVPPDQKPEASEAPMDSSYARILEQQQLFLQLQIISQQQQHYNYQTILPAPLKPVVEGQTNGANNLPTSIMVSLPAPAPVRPNNSLSNRRPGVLPANLEDMKVAELKMELKLRGLPVSGTKTDLIERLRPFQESPSLPSAAPAPASGSVPGPSPGPSTLCSLPMEVTSAPALLLPNHQGGPETMSPTPPVSTIPLDPSSLREDPGMSERPWDPQTVSPGRPGSSPLGLGILPGMVREEKDRRLHEKERQIEELMRKLEQEQRLVEELKMQLEVEKRGPVAPNPSMDTSITSSLIPNTLTSNSVKMEGRVSPNCSITATSILGAQPQPPALSTVVKLEEAVSVPHLQLQNQTYTQQPHTQTQTQPNHYPQPSPPSLPQFFFSHQGAVSHVLGQPQTLQPGTQILLPVSLPSNATAIQLPTTAVSLQATMSNQAPGLVQASIPQMHSANIETAPSQQLANHNRLLQNLTVCNSTGSGMVENQTRPEMHPQVFLSSSPENNRISPRASPNHTLSNGPTNKSASASQPTFLLHPSNLVGQPPKAREPPRYEDAVKQSRNLHTNNLPQVTTATSQQMDDLFDILIQSGEMTPFIQHDPPLSLTKTIPLHTTTSATVTTLPVNTALSRHPPQVQSAPPPTLSPSSDPSFSLSPPGIPGLILSPSPDPSLSLTSLASDNQLEAFLERSLGVGVDPSPTSDPRTLGLMAELQTHLLEQPYSPMDTSELSFCDSSSPPSSLNMGLSDPALDNMEWLDLTMPTGPAGGVTPLGIPSDLLDTHDLQLHWD
ncbi:myocardin-related transcription factor B isoform X3 [Osmerus eperlanus]|uniref:myocardin-related transcription factor B isoform X3 n=1 Tax=Osmerus eperlanus TaxID=29151 RepID=UPI002E0E69E9